MCSMGGEFTAEQLTRFQEFFAQYDTNSDGSISGDELLPLMESLGLKSSRRHIKAFLKSTDIDSSGSIDFGEFVNMIAARMKLEPIRKMFQNIDKDGDGYLTVDELRLGLQELDENVTDADLAKFVSNADTNGDGRVDYIEFAMSMVLSGSSK